VKNVALLRLRGRVIDLDEPRVMGIVNVTPDSFYDGGRFHDAGPAVEHARQLAAEGADIIDIGGMSSRPGAADIPVAEELRRILPVVDTVLETVSAAVSVDTCRAETARVALEHGVHMVNDISALGDPLMARLVAEAGSGLVLMHMQGTPATMQRTPRYEDVVTEIARYLKERAGRAQAEGVAPEAIAIDPGIGFGKTVEHNLEILRRLAELAALGYPVLVGTSRKSFIGKVLGVEAEGRLLGSLASVVVARLAGASLFRVHDVAETRQVLAITEAIGRGWRARSTEALTG
jgi:dihydropteroate synthase